jgi:hypothetical protein
MAKRLTQLEQVIERLEGEITARQVAIAAIRAQLNSKAHPLGGAVVGQDDHRPEDEA